jgi:hypothetical protein
VAHISGAVEGPSDEVVLRRIVAHCHGHVHRVQVQGGKDHLRRAVSGYNAAAVRDPWLVLVDLDRDYSCAAALVESWLPVASPYMRFRVVVRQIEAWLLADSERFAKFFGVKRSAVPGAPDDLEDARAGVLRVVGRSHRSAIRQDMLPRPRSGRRVGAAYTSRLIEFASDAHQGWRPDVAAKRSPSLARCLARLRELTVLP